MVRVFGWGEDDEGQPLDPPDEVGAAQLNKWLFNTDTVDQVLEHLMTEGIRVAGGDRLGKTIIFAKNQRHADFIKERFDANYPALDAGNFARVITHQTNYAQSLIDDFSNKDKAPHIAISVDMLDTGIDVPEVVNLVYFKLVRSKTKFWQMLGRGTRLCENLFGPDDHKTHFNVFDFCQNLEFFSQELDGAEPSDTRPLSEVLFSARLELLEALDGIVTLGDSTEVDLPGTGGTVASNEFEQFHKKARHFLQEHLADDIVAKVRSGQLITAADIRELQRVLVAAGIGDTDTFAQASQRAGSFGLFIRSIVGLDRAAAKQAFARFLDDRNYSRNQIEFVNLVIDYLTQHGTIDPGRVYESPFTAIAPQGPETIFETPDLDEFFNIVQHLHDTAAA